MDFLCVCVGTFRREVHWKRTQWYLTATLVTESKESFTELMLKLQLMVVEPRKEPRDVVSECAENFL